MRSIKIIIGSILSFFILNSTLGAQSVDRISWRTYAHITGGYFLSDNKWEISHPYYGGSGGVTWETITGEIASSGVVGFGIEFAKKHIGFRFDLSIMPLDFKIDPSTEYVNLNAYVTELSFIVYPKNSQGGKIYSFFALGGGLYFTDADVIKRGYVFSGKFGLGSFVINKVGISFSIAGKYLIHNQAEVQDQIQKTLNMTNTSLNLDLIYSL